ncbi:MAG: BlaI/MecI/CopY family transcriptional regulator [Planctomycetota bacterium]
MPKRTAPQPAEGELLILQVLWKQGPSTVRDVHEALSRTRSTGYTTTLKRMQIMADKGLVTRDESRRTHIYHPKISQEQAQRQLVNSLVNRAFEGCTKRLVMQALSVKKTSPADLADIRRLLDELESGES